MRRSWMGLCLLGMICIAVLAGCSSPKPKPTAQPVKIGAVLPLTGEGAKYGEAARNAIELAADEINSKGGVDGRKLVVVYEDSAGKPANGVTVFQKLIDTDHVQVVIGDLFSSVVLAMAPVAQQKKVVILSPTGSAPKITQAGDYVFRNCASDTYEGSIMGNAAPSRLNIKKVAVLYINNDYGVGITDVFRPTLSKAGGKVVAQEAFQQGATDFRAQLTKIKGAAPDGVYLVGYKELGQALKQAKQLGLRAKFLSTVMFEDPDILKVAGNAAEGVVYSARAYDPASKDPSVSSFVAQFRSRYHADPDIFAALSYDALNIAALAIQRGGATADGIKGALYGISDFPGVVGKTSFDKNGDVDQPAVLKTVRNGKFVPLQSGG